MTLIAGVMLFNLSNRTLTRPDSDANEQAQFGSVLATPGAGVWEQVANLRPVENLLAITFAPGGRLGVAIGVHGELVVTQDGGSTWDVRSSIVLGELSVATCVAIPDSERVLFGTSVDEDWPAATLYEIKLADGALERIWQGEYGGLFAASRDGRFWAGENCFILRVDDTDFSPTRLPSCDGEVIYGVDASRSLVLAVGMHGLVDVSRDDGKTWTSVRLKPPSELENEPLEIHRVATNGQNAIAGGNYGGLWRSEDGGGTWIPVRGLGSKMSVWALHLAPDGTVCFVAGGDREGGSPFVLATNDGGRTFTPEPVRDARGRIMGIAQGKAGVFAVTYDGRVLVRRAGT
jgi:photosystem II stability/assembly factor-like uncharacterized protein